MHSTLRQSDDIRTTPPNRCNALTFGTQTSRLSHALWKGRALLSTTSSALPTCPAVFEIPSGGDTRSPALEHHDRNASHIVAVSYGPDDKSAMRRRISSAPMSSWMCGVKRR